MLQFVMWLVGILTVAWRSYVAVTLWHWFVEPIGGAHVSVVRAMGIGLIVNLVIRRVSSADIEADERSKVKLGKSRYHVTQLVFAVLGPLLVLGFGWLYAQWL